MVRSKEGGLMVRRKGRGMVRSKGGGLVVRGNRGGGGEWSEVREEGSGQKQGGGSGQKQRRGEGMVISEGGRRNGAK